MKDFTKPSRKWDDISLLKRRESWLEIDKRSNNIIHLNNGTIRYDFNTYSSWSDAVRAEYAEYGAEAGKNAMDCVMSFHEDAVDEWNKWIKLGFIKEEDYWTE